MGVSYTIHTVRMLDNYTLDSVKLLNQLHGPHSHISSNFLTLYLTRPLDVIGKKVQCHGWYSSLRIPFVNNPVGHVVSELKYSANHVSGVYGWCNAVWIRIIMFDIDTFTIAGLKSTISAVKSVFQNRELIRRDDFKDSERCIAKTQEDSER